EATLTTHLNNEASRAQGAETTLTTHVTALQTLTAPLSLSGTDFIITGVNVHIVDGSGFTDDNVPGGGTLTGLGNLTIGYNGLRDDFSYPDVRTGSHNLILGDQNNYSSYGGSVAGVFNNILGPYAYVSGGSGNTASGIASTVSGGAFNTASGSPSTI